MKRIVLAVLALNVLFCLGCGGGGGGSSSSNGGTTGGDINVSEYLPLKIGNSWVYYDQYGDRFIDRLEKTTKFGDVDVPTITEYFPDGTAQGQVFYWTSDANGWTIYGKCDDDGILAVESPPARIPNHLVDGATGKTGSNMTYTVKKTGSYTLRTGKTFDDTITVIFTYPGDSESFILARGVGVIREGQYYLFDWTIR